MGERNTSPLAQFKGLNHFHGSPISRVKYKTAHYKKKCPTISCSNRAWWLLLRPVVGFTD